MIGDRPVEFPIDLQRFFLAAVARKVAAVGLDRAQRDRVGLVSAFIALAGFLLVVGDIEDEPGVGVLEDGVPVRSSQLVERFDRGVRVARARESPCRKQRRRQIGHRAAHRLREVLPRHRVLLLLERPHADHQPRDAVSAIELDEPVGEPCGFVDVAFAEHGEESAAEQIGVARIGLEHVEVIGGRGGGVALDSGMPRGQVTAGGGRVYEFLRRGRLGGECRRQAQGDSGASDGGVPWQQQMNHDSSIGRTKAQTGESGRWITVERARMTLLPCPRKQVRPLGPKGGEIAAAGSS